MQPSHLLPLVSCLAAWLTQIDAPAERAAPPALFLQVDASAIARVTPDATVARERIAAARVELLRDAMERAVESPPVELNLFPDRTFVAHFDRFERDASDVSAFVAYAKLDGDAESSAICAVRGDMLMASVRTGRELYKLTFAGSGLTRIAAIDESRFPTCATSARHAVVSAGAPAGGQYSANPNPTIDVMVVYTPLARANIGGTPAMEALCDLAVAESNQAYQNSQVTQRLRLVHTAELTGYNENGDFNTELNRLTDPGDGQFDYVHGLRDQYGADEVVMIVDGTQYCGIAWLMTVLGHAFEDHAFAVVSKQCATGYYSFAHELGHNMASHHDHANAGPALYPYSYGYRTPSGNWRTVMAYAPGTRIQYFSNPNVSFQGEALGVPAGQPGEAENWKSLNNTATTVAQWRCAIPKPYGAGKTTSIGTQPSLSFSGAPSAGSTAFTLELTSGLPNKVGLAFYGTQSNSAPFLGGTLYVGGAIQRLPALLNSASGTASIPLPLTGFAVGDVLYCQHWGRDPQHPDGTGASLSNGLRVDVCP